MDKDAAIGVFDSGFGGLTAVRELIKLLPGEDEKRRIYNRIS